MATRVLGLCCAAAGGLEELRRGLIKPMVDDGWRVAVTATPTAAEWLRASGEVRAIESLTGLQVRYQPRLPSELSVHPKADCYAVVPATANSVAKLAMGIADNQVLTQVGEAIGARQPVVIFPRVNSAHAAHPKWDEHLQVLQSAGVRLVYGPDVWPLHPPRQAPARQLPWAAIRQAIEASLPSQR